MPRQTRITIPDVPHHVTQRGNYKQIVFEKEEDYQKYSRWVPEYSRKYQVDVLAYCFMNNHVHFIVIPRLKNSLSRFFNTIHMRYAQYVNKKHKTKGHLWQGRFFSCLLDDPHLYRAIRYIEENPVRAGMVKKAWDYPYSSAKHHIGLNKSPIISGDNPFNLSAEEWKEYLMEDDEKMDNEIRLKTGRGLVVGSEEFVAKIEKKLGRSLECRGRGRPSGKK